MKIQVPAEILTLGCLRGRGAAFLPAGIDLSIGLHYRFLCHHSLLLQLVRLRCGRYCRSRCTNDLRIRAQDHPGSHRARVWIALAGQSGGAA